MPEEKKLSARQERFCEEYVIDYDAAEAARRAGYHPDYGRRLLSCGRVLGRVRALQSEQVRRLGISADWVVMQLVDIYRRCTQQEPVLVWDAKKREKVETGAFTFDCKGALSALEQIAKHTGGFDGAKSDEPEELLVRFTDAGAAE